MALIFLAGAGLYLWSRTTAATHFPGQLKPTDTSNLPPMNIFNPATNDTIRPRADQYDPRRIGYTVRINTRNVKGDYPQERRIGAEAADKPYALHRRQAIQDAYVQQQGAYIAEHPFLEPVYWNTGVKAPRKINSLGNPAYKRIIPPRR